MEFLLNRYRNLTVLLVGHSGATGAAGLPGEEQRRSAADPRLGGERRHARSRALIEAGRSGTVAFLPRLLRAVGRARREQAHEGGTGSHPRWRISISGPSSPPPTAPSPWRFFKQQSPSKTIAAHIIGNTTGVRARKWCIIDRGTSSGIQKGHGGHHAGWHRRQGDGVYPTASYVLLITDPSFAAGVISQKNRVHGTLKGQGNSTVIVDYVQNEAESRARRMVLHLRRRPHFPQGSAGRAKRRWCGHGKSLQGNLRHAQRFAERPAKKC